ncbi:hypothetical protein RclHR1_03680009 [Rhizophagus clarus]|uniref:Reverse transcriptase domain-containing protein n=1 Tax=Rhizophagus clarus TaxID=94130 RepID=A0A2Z6RNW9_9GLOM|nr:hypothetical protein RclHR1_03680009 [Rhizophagus clarus]
MMSPKISLFIKRRNNDMISNQKPKEDIEATPLYRSLNDLPPDFRDIYKPSSNYSSWLYSNVLNLVTQAELISTISSLPNNKAAGISNITYEDIKHLHVDFYDFIITFFNDILQTGYLPDGWNNAYLYPIPKRILHGIISRPGILQSNNYACLIGESTFQSLQHLSCVIKMANLHKQELWIGIQDLSKAYDGINTSLLKLALKRLHFPPLLINIIMQLFTNRLA